MSEQIPNTFTTYEFTDKEELQGQILTTLQKQNIQNQRARVAEEKLALDFDTSKPEVFTQQEAYKRGQLEVLTWLLEASDAAELALVNGTNLDETDILEN